VSALSSQPLVNVRRLPFCSSPQFRAAVSNFDQALRTGLLGGLVRGLGLPDEAGTGILPFLRALQEQADREGSGGGNGSDEDMETD
jgi:26S proteasome regulatory subunit N13